MFAGFDEYPRRGFTVRALNGHCPIPESIVYFYSYMLERRGYAWDGISSIGLLLYLQACSSLFCFSA